MKQTFYANPGLVPCKLFKAAVAKTKRHLFLENCLNLPWRRQRLYSISLNAEKSKIL